MHDQFFINNKQHVSSLGLISKVFYRLLVFKKRPRRKTTRQYSGVNWKNYYPERHFRRHWLICDPKDHVPITSDLISNKNPLLYMKTKRRFCQAEKIGAICTISVTKRAETTAWSTTWSQNRLFVRVNLCSASSKNHLRKDLNMKPKVSTKMKWKEEVVLP